MELLSGALAFLGSKEVMSAIVTLILVVIERCFKIKVDPQVVLDAATETVGYLQNDADGRRNDEGRIDDLNFIKELRRAAVKEMRRLLKGKKPWYVPRFFWNRAIKRLENAVLHANIEGILEEIKNRFDK